MFKKTSWFALFFCSFLLQSHAAAPPPPSSYLPVVDKETFQAVMDRMTSAKQALNDRQQALLNQRYDMSNRPSKDTMTGGKPLQDGVRVKLPTGTTWDD